MVIRLEELESEYHLVGVPFDPNMQPAVFELRIHDHIPAIKPEDYGLPADAPSFDPLDYFVTSGDAVHKTKFMSKELWAFAGKVRSYVGSYAGNAPKDKKAAYEKAAWSAAGKANVLLNNLIKARDPACFLETEWRCHSLLCIPKNPKKHPEE